VIKVKIIEKEVERRRVAVSFSRIINRMITG
jgi:hypothetical protein